MIFAGRDPRWPHFAGRDLRWAWPVLPEAFNEPEANYQDLDGKALGEDEVPGLLEDVGDRGLAVTHDADSISDYSDASEDGDESVHGQSKMDGTPGG